MLYPVSTVFARTLMAVFLGDRVANRGALEIYPADYLPTHGGAAEIHPRYYGNLIDDPLRAALDPLLDETCRACGLARSRESIPPLDVCIRNGNGGLYPSGH